MPRFASALLLPSLLILPMLMFGCASPTGTANVQFHALDSNRLFREHFSQAYYSQSDDGDRTVLLVDEGLPRSASKSSGPISPLQNIPLTQMIRLKILWNPLHGTRIDAPSTTNCIIDWVIRESGPTPGTDSLRYQGAGFVLADGGDGMLTLKIRSATLAAAQHSGQLQDPIGRCELSGKFTAIRDDQLVATTAAQMDAVAFSTRPGN